MQLPDAPFPALFPHVPSEKGQFLSVELPSWEFHSYQLISLWVILKNYAHSFAEVDGLLMAQSMLLIQLTGEGDEFSHVPEFECSRALELLEKTNKLCRSLGLRGTQAYIRKIKAARPWLFGSLQEGLRGIRECMEWELSETYFLHIRAERVPYYDSAFFGEEIEERFPSAREDMREAANCFALCRWTAVVHHCMGVVQSGLELVGQHLKMKTPIDIHIHTWNEIITKIEGEVIQKGKAATTPTAQSEWKKVEPLYNEMISDVRAMKNAWRNPTAHFRRIYTEEQAEKVLERVKDFIRNLVTGLELRE